jgi:hypothetical protein
VLIIILPGGSPLHYQSIDSNNSSNRDTFFLLFINQNHFELFGLFVWDICCVCSFSWLSCCSWRSYHSWHSWHFVVVEFTWYTWNGAFVVIRGVHGVRVVYGVNKRRSCYVMSLFSCYIIGMGMIISSQYVGGIRTIWITWVATGHIRPSSNI